MLSRDRGLSKYFIQTHHSARPLCFAFNTLEKVKKKAGCMIRALASDAVNRTNSFLFRPRGAHREAGSKYAAAL